MQQLRKILILAVFGSVSMLGFADSVNFQNAGGVLNSSSGLTKLVLAGAPEPLSFLIGISGLGSAFDGVGANLGSLTFMTGSLLSGSLLSNATFGAGGLFTETGSVGGGFTFSGSFASGAHWTEIASNTWTFSGMIDDGILTEGSKHFTIPTAAITLLTEAGVVPTVGSNGSLHFDVAGATTSFNAPGVVPEPGTLSLLGTGLLCLGMVMRRRASTKSHLSS